MLIRLLVLEVARTAESMALAAREAARRRLSTGQLSRTLQALQIDMDHLAPLIRSLVDQDQDARSRDDKRGLIDVDRAPNAV